jgi:uncharacterized membrane protein YbhN (UPF0104 family)
MDQARQRKRLWITAIKLMFVGAFGWFLIQRFQAQQDGELIWKAFDQGRESGWSPMLLIILLLMPVNWFMEVIKWKILMRPSLHLSWRRAVLGVLSGITFSLFTPNRMGEYGGRILYAGRNHAWQAVIASVTGSFAQNIIHISFGLIAGLLMFNVLLGMPQVTGRGIWILSIGVILVAWLIYWKLPSIAIVLNKWKPPNFMTSFWKALAYLTQVTSRELGAALFLGFVRYLIFCMQYILLLQFFGADISWWMLAGGVAVIYLLQTMIPLPPFVDLIARNELGILMWAGLGVNEITIIAAGFGIWIINLLIPALFGLLAITAVNIPKALGYEHDIIPSAVQLPDRTLDGGAR